VNKKKDDAVLIEAERIVRDEFPAKILRLTEKLNGDGLSLDRLTQVRDTTANWTVPTADTTAVATADAGAPAQKRRRMQTISVPSNDIIVQVGYRSLTSHSSHGDESLQR